MEGDTSSPRRALHRPRRWVARQVARGRAAARERPVHAAAFALVFAVGVALRLYGLGAESLWVDEVITVALVRRYDPVELLTAVPRKQPHLPAYYALLDLWRGLSGSGDAAMRALSAACSVAVLPLCYALGTRLFDRRGGLGTMAVVALSRFQVAYGQEIRMYALLTLLTVASFYCLLRRAERGWAAAYVATAVGAAYVHPFGGLAVLGGLAYLAVARRAGTPAWPGAAGDRRGPALIALALCPLAAGAAVEFATGFDLTFVPPPGPGMLARTLRGFLGTWPTWWVGAAVGTAFGLAGVLAVVVGLRGDRATGATALVLCWLLVPLAVLVAVSHLVTPVFWPRYVAGAAPAWYLLVGRGLGLVWPGGGAVTRLHRGRLLRVAVVALLVLSLMPSVTGYHTTDQHEEWDSAVADIEARAAPDALVVVNNCMTVTAYREYDTRSDLDVAGVVGPESGMAVDRTDDDRVREVVRNRSEVWLVLSHAVSRERERMRRLLAERHDMTWYRSYVGIEVVRYERPVVPNVSDSLDRFVRAEQPTVPNASGSVDRPRPEMACHDRLL